ncbi:WD40 repeat domain-containing protein [Scytonema sp. HK-05]
MSVSFSPDGQTLASGSSNAFPTARSRGLLAALRA